MAAAESDLLDVQLTMLKDVGFWDKCRRRVREDLIKVEEALAEEVRELAVVLEGFDQEFMRERSADIRDNGAGGPGYPEAGGGPNRMRRSGGKSGSRLPAGRNGRQGSQHEPVSGHALYVRLP